MYKNIDMPGDSTKGAVLPGKRMHGIIRRLLSVIPVFFGITIICFLVLHMLPGGLVQKAIHLTFSREDSLITAETSPGSSPGTHTVIAGDTSGRLNEIFDFNEPLTVQYIRWLAGIFTADLGTSPVTHKPVLAMIIPRILVTLSICIGGLILSFLVALLAGIAAVLQPALLFNSVVKRKSIRDRILNVIISTGYTIPGFAFGLLIFLLFREKIFFPDPGYGTWGVTLYASITDNLHLTILPGLCYTIGGLAFFTSSIKQSFYMEAGKGYIKTALAAGSGFGTTMLRSCRNGLIPVFRGFSRFFPVFLSGSFIIENIFRIPGTGLLGCEAVIQKDYPVVIGLVLVYALVSLFITIIVDICIIAADPFNITADTAVSDTTVTTASADLSLYKLRRTGSGRRC